MYQNTIKVCYSQNSNSSKHITNYIGNCSQNTIPPCLQAHIGLSKRGRWLIKAPFICGHHVIHKDESVIHKDEYPHSRVQKSRSQHAKHSLKNIIFQP